MLDYFDKMHYNLQGSCSVEYDLICFPYYCHNGRLQNNSSAYEALVIRGAKESRSIYLGGGRRDKHLLLGGRVEKMAYKQRI